MTIGNGRPPMLDGCAVLPAMEAEEVAHKAEPTEPRKASDRRTSGDRFAVLNAFVDAAAGELNRSELLVWLVLYRDTRNGIAETSQADIARRAKLCSRTVRYAIGKLVARGLLVLVYRGGINRGPSKYRVSADLRQGELRQ